MTQQFQSNGNYQQKLDKLERQVRGKISKSMGMSNESRSIKFVLDHYEQYGVPTRQHIEITPRGTQHHKDLFSVDYYTKGGKKDKAGFDIVALADESSEYVTHLIQVKSNHKPSYAYIKALSDIKVHPLINKELHIWKNDELVIIPL